MIADFHIAAEWKGTDGHPSDYSRACGFFDSQPGIQGGKIAIGDGEGILWEMNGPGTAKVLLKAKEHIIVIRVWPLAGQNGNATHLIAQIPTTEAVDLGTINSISGSIAFLWAAESGECLGSTDADVVRPSGIDDSALIIGVKPGEYRCEHDEVTTTIGRGRRLSIVQV